MLCHAGTLPCMRHAAWHEGTGAGAADRDLAGRSRGVPWPTLKRSTTGVVSMIG